MLENMAYIVGGILAGVMCKLDASFMNKMSAVCLGSRVLYLFSYIHTSNQRLSPLRTVWYLSSSLAIMALYWKAGWKVAAGQLA
jgi:MAPEG family